MIQIRSYAREQLANLYGEYVEWVEQSFRPVSLNKPTVNVRIGDNVHLLGRSGIYKVKSVTGGQVRLTTNKWISEKERGDRKTDYQDVNINDIKCLAGGRYLKRL